jgi:hypothetical protein
MEHLVHVAKALYGILSDLVVAFAAPSSPVAFGEEDLVAIPL